MVLCCQFVSPCFNSAISPNNLNVLPQKFYWNCIKCDISSLFASSCFEVNCCWLSLVICTPKWLQVMSQYHFSMCPAWFSLKHNILFNYLREVQLPFLLTLTWEKFFSLYDCQRICNNQLNFSFIFAWIIHYRLCMKNDLNQPEFFSGDNL